MLTSRQYHTSDNTLTYAEVQYYFRLGTTAYAVIHPYDGPDPALREKSCNTLWVTSRTDRVVVIEAQKILSVVGVVPLPRPDGRLGSYDGRVFIFEKMGLDVMPLSESELEVDRDQEDDALLS